MGHMRAEGTSERASEFLFRMAAHPNLVAVDKKKMREVANLFISKADLINLLREENERLWLQLSNKGQPDPEVPF